MSWRKVSYVLSTSEDYVWRELDYFASPDNVRRFIDGRHPSLHPRTAKTKAIEISSCVKQAEEYYASAKKADYVTKPVLLFFGMEGLTSALNIILKRDLTMRHFRKSHGVEFMKHGLPETGTDLSKVLVTIKKGGTFYELFALRLFDWALPRHHNPGRNLSKLSAGYREEKDKLSFVNCSVRLRDLLSVIPEVGKDYHRVFGEHPNVFSGGYTYYWKGDKPEKIEVFIDKTTSSITREVVLRKLSMLRKGYEITEEGGYFKFSCGPNSEAPLLCEDMYEETFLKGSIEVFKGQRLELFDNQLGLLDMEAHFLIMFALSILCRYELRLWQNLMVEKKGGIDYLLRRFLECSCSKYPLLVLREIQDSNIRQRAPGTVIKHYR